MLTIAPARRIDVELVLVLDRAQLLDEPVARHEVDASRVEPRVPLERKRRRLEADRPVQDLGQRLEEVTLRLDELDAVDRSRGLGVAEVREDADALGLDEERGVRALEPAEIEDVGRVGDEQRLLQPLAQAVDALAHELAPRYSSASR